MSRTGPRAARADFGFVAPGPTPQEMRQRYRAWNLPRQIRAARERLARLTAEAAELGVTIPEGVDA